MQLKHPLVEKVAFNIATFTYCLNAKEWIWMASICKVADFGYKKVPCSRVDVSARVISGLSLMGKQLIRRIPSCIHSLIRPSFAGLGSTRFWSARSVIHGDWKPGFGWAVLIAPASCNILYPVKEDNLSALLLEVYIKRSDSRFRLTCFEVYTIFWWRHCFSGRLCGVCVCSFWWVFAWWAA